MRPNPAGAGRKPMGGKQKEIKHNFFTVIFAKSPNRENVMTNFSTILKWFNIKRVILISCSGILLLLLSIPVFLTIKLINSRPPILWEYPVGNTVMASPTIDEGTIYSGSLDDFKSSTFYAFDTMTGEEKWGKSVKGSVTTSPVISNEMLYFCTDDGFCYGVDKNTGQEYWAMSPEERDLDASNCDKCALRFSQPIVEDTLLYVGSLDHNLYALDSQTGVIRWSFNTGDSILSAPTISNGRIYLGSNDGKIYVIDARTGIELHNFSIPPSLNTNSEPGIYATPLIDSTTIYAVNGSLLALDIHSGNILWEFSGQSPLGQIIGNPSMFENSIITPTIDAIYAIDKATGEPIWKFSDIKGGVFFSPVLENGSIYFGDSSGYLYILNAKTGHQVRKYNMNLLDLSSYATFTAEFVFQPAVKDGMIYVGWNNEFYAIRNNH